MTSPSMLDQIEALNGATDWNDPNLFERIAAADFEGDNQNAAPAAPQGDSTPAPAPTASNEPPAVAEPAKTTDAGFEQYTLEAVRDGIVGVAQGVDILGHKDTRRAEWALSLLASGKITVDQCDRLLFAKSV